MASLDDRMDQLKNLFNMGVGASNPYSTPATGLGGGFGPSNPYGPYTPTPQQPNYGFSSPNGNPTPAWQIISGMMPGLGTAASAVAAFLPTTQESVPTEQIANRMRFYQLGAGKTVEQNYRIMNAAMQQGTPVTPGDILSAIQASQAIGLGPGLSNFMAGPNTDVGRFSGVLGGAALASNLSPGIGLTGGVGVMATLNQANTVNTMRMLGIQNRTVGGATMQDLPTIIEQIYGLLTRNNQNITEEDIAVSSMSGNALDSLLSQMVGNDQAARSTIIAGLIQRNKTKYNLRFSGQTYAPTFSTSTAGKVRDRAYKFLSRLGPFALSPAFSLPAGILKLFNASDPTGEKPYDLQSTGGTIGAVTSSGYRNAREQEMIEKYSNVTNRALIGTNNFLQTIYGALASNTFGDTETPPGLGILQQTSTALTGLGAARGGAGALAMSAVLEGGANIGKALGPLVASYLTDGVSNGVPGANAMLSNAGGAITKFFTAAGMGAGAQMIGTHGRNPVILTNSPYDPSSAPTSSPTSVGPTFTGGITINVSVPPGSDPYAYSAAMKAALS